MKVWDGVDWVSHDGPVFRGYRETIEYEGLVATPDHEVWIEEECQPIPLRQAASGGAHLVTSEINGNPVRLDRDNVGSYSRDKGELSLRGDSMHGMRQGTMDIPLQSYVRQEQRLLCMFETENSNLRFITPLSSASETAMHKSEGQSLSQLRWSRNRISFQESGRSPLMGNGEPWLKTGRNGPGSQKQRWSLRTRQYSMGDAARQCDESENNSISVFQGQKSAAGLRYALDQIFETG